MSPYGDRRAASGGTEMGALSETSHLRRLIGEAFYADAIICTFPSSTMTSAGSGWLRKRPGLAVRP
jgi:hypothetical protein